MEYNAMGKKLVQAFSERMVPKGAVDHMRPDLYLADWEHVSRDSAKLLVGWAVGLDVPKLAAIDNFVLASWEGKLKMNTATMRVHPDDHLATVMVRKLAPTRRMKDADTMARVSPSRYVEAETKAVWEVRQDDDGGKHLVMLQEANLGQLLEERRRAVKVRKGSVPTFTKLRSQGYIEVCAGDRVKFYHKGLLKEGQVTRMMDDELLIKSGSGTSSVRRSAVVDMVQKDPATLDDQKERVRDYWTQVYGKDYVDKWLGMIE